MERSREVRDVEAEEFMELEAFDVDDVDDFDFDALEQLEPIEAIINKMNVKKDIFPREQLLKQKKRVLADREKDAKNYNKAKNLMAKWYRQMQYYEKQVKEKDEELTKIERELRRDVDAYGFN